MGRPLNRQSSPTRHVVGIPRGYSPHMKRFAPLLVTGCIHIELGKGHDTGSIAAVEDVSNPFLNDCDEVNNDEPEAAILFEGAQENIDLCERDVDFYTVDIQPDTWLSLTMEINGSGHNGTDATDLDLWELNHPDNPIDVELDRFDTNLDGYDIIWASESHSSLERLAWFNISSSAQRKVVMVTGFDGAVSEYTLKTTESNWSPDRGCETDCDDLLLFPQAATIEDGYVVTQWTQYSHTRRAVAYHIQRASAHVRDVYGDIAPLGLGDMSQYDAAIPGLIENAPRHPEGRHEHGNEIDLAYYQTGFDNALREVCENDGAFCTDEPDRLDIGPTALLIATILEDDAVLRVVTDPLVREQLVHASNGLTPAQQNRLQNGIVSGNDWPGAYRGMHVQFATARSTPIEG